MLGLGLGIPKISSSASRIGETYQGGIIFYLDGSGGGLIAAPADETASQWGCNGTNLLGVDGTAIGTGAQNTIDILAQCSTANIAADRCRDKNDGTYTDWFLPSEDELNEMWLNRGVLDTSAARYWSSTEKTATKAGLQVFDLDGAQNGYQGQTSKLVVQAVRAIRAF